MQIEKMSASRLRTFYTCGARYYFRWCLGLVIPPASQLMVGSSFHASIAHNYSQKIASHEDLKLADVQEKFAWEFDQRSYDTRWLPGEDKGKIKDRGIGALTAYQSDVAPGVQPAGVEHEFIMPMRQGDKLLDWYFEGHIDVVTEQEVIREAKTIASTPPRPLAHDTLQVTAYTAGRRVETGASSVPAALDYAVKTKQPKTVSFPFAAQAADIALFLHLLNTAVHMMENEIWIPNRACLTCSDMHCGYWDLCHKQKWS